MMDFGRYRLFRVTFLSDEGSTGCGSYSHIFIGVQVTSKSIEEDMAAAIQMAGVFTHGDGTLVQVELETDRDLFVLL